MSLNLYATGTASEVGYVLPTASATTLGGIKVGSNLTISNGVLSANTGSTVSISRSLTSGTKIGTITINGTATDLYCQTNTDTHHAGYLYAGASGGTANAAVSADPYLLYVENGANRSGVQLKAGTSIGISSDNKGVITIKSTIGAATSSTAGIGKLYTATGSSTDGSMTQKAITDAIAAAAGGQGFTYRRETTEPTSGNIGEVLFLGSAAPYQIKIWNGSK